MFVFRSFSSPLDSPDASCQKVRSCGYQSFWITSSGSQTLWGGFFGHGSSDDWWPWE